MSPEIDIYEAARKKILAKIKKDMGNFPKAMVDLTVEQKKKVENFAERYEIEASEIYALVLKDKNVFLAIAAKDPKRMGFYEQALCDYLQKQSSYIRDVKILKKSGSQARFINRGIISNKRPADVKSLDLLVTLNNKSEIYVIHKYTHQAGGVQSSALTDVKNTLKQLNGNNSAGSNVFIAAILDGDYYAKTTARSKVSKLEQTRRDYPNVIVTTHKNFVADSKKFLSSSRTDV